MFDDIYSVIISLCNYYQLRGHIKNYINDNKKEELFKICPIFYFHVKILYKKSQWCKEHALPILVNEDDNTRAKKIGIINC